MGVTIGVSKKVLKVGGGHGPGLTSSGLTVTTSPGIELYGKSVSWKANATLVDFWKLTMQQFLLNGAYQY